ncbi:MAG: hypothetical protein ACI4MI_04875 [Christensenellales bacterium]
MRYLKLTYSFLKHNALKMFLYALAPALLYPLVYNPASIFNFLLSSSETDMHGFVEMYMAINSINGPGWIFAFLAALLVGGVSLGAMAGSIQRRMRYGVEYRNSLGNFWNKVNSFFLPIIMITLELTVIMQIFALLLSIICFIWLKIGSHVAFVVLTVITTLVLLFALLFVISMFITTFPNMTIKGFGAIKSLSISVGETLSHIFSIMFSIALPFVGLVIPVMLVNLLHFTGSGLIKYIVNVLYYLAIFMIGLPLVYTIFFDINDMEREDIATYKEWGLK